MIKSSEIKVGGKKSDYILNLCKEVGATEYISGLGGKTYLDEQLLTCKVSYFEPNVKNTYSIIQHI